MVTALTVENMMCVHACASPQQQVEGGPVRAGLTYLRAESRRESGVVLVRTQRLVNSKSDADKDSDKGRRVG